MNKKQFMGIFLAGLMLFSIFGMMVSMMVDAPEMETGSVVNEEFKLDPISVRSFFFNSSILIEQNITNNTNVSDMKFLSAIVEYENDTFMITDSQFGVIIDLEYDEKLTEDDFDLYLTDMQPYDENTTFFNWYMVTGNETFVTNHNDMTFEEDMIISF